MAADSEITAPVAKAAAALSAGAGSSAMSMANQAASNHAASFFPTDASGWMAFTASTVAVLYTMHLLGEWYWKKVWRPFMERKGWIKPKPRGWYGPRLEPDEATD